MPFELEALVGHLYIVGGRSISTSPPGALVEVAPQKAARGRETDTFFSLMLPSGETTAPTAFYKRMAQSAAERYFRSSGSVTAGLRQVFTDLNRELFEHNKSSNTHYEVNAICAVLRSPDLYLARVGASLAVVRYDGRNQTFPEDLINDEAIFKPPLGVQPIPDIHMAHYSVGHGSRLVLGDANIADLDPDKLSAALLAPDIGEVLVALTELVPLYATCMTAEFVKPDASVPVAVHIGESTTAIAENLAVARAEARAREAALPKTRLGKGVRSASEGVQKGARRGVGKTALSLARIITLIDDVIDHFFPPPEEGQRKRLGTPIATTIAIAIPLAVVLLVVSMWLGGTGETEFETCVANATEAGNQARGIDSSNVNATLAAWNGTLEIIASCDGMRVGDETLAALKREGQDVIDGLNQIDRRDTLVIQSFQGATLTSIVMQGLDLYVLDEANQLAYRIQLNGDGRAAAGLPQPISSMRRNAIVEQLAVGDIIDIAFNEAQNTILAVDEGGVVVECSPRFVQQSCQSQRLVSAENWVAPTAMTLWEGKLYVLDPGGNQIWRYEPSGRTYANEPTEYFSARSRPNLINVTDFGIDENGTVFILYRDGLIGKYRAGEQQDFGYGGIPEGQPLNSAAALFLNNSPLSQRMYIVSQDTRTIYEMSFGGTFFNSYRAYDESRFASISGVATDPGLQMIYTISGNSVLAFEKGD